MQGKAQAAGSWYPMPFEKARDTLVDQLSRNLGLWTLGMDDGPQHDYSTALWEMARETEPASGILSWRLRDHWLTITREDLHH